MNFVQTLGDHEEQRGLACCTSRDLDSLDEAGQLNRNQLLNIGTSRKYNPYQGGRAVNTNILKNDRDKNIHRKKDFEHLL